METTVVYLILCLCRACIFYAWIRGGLYRGYIGVIERLYRGYIGVV